MILLPHYNASKFWHRNSSHTHRKHYLRSNIARSRASHSRGQVAASCTAALLVWFRYASRTPGHHYPGFIGRCINVKTVFRWNFGHSNLQMVGYCRAICNLSKHYFFLRIWTLCYPCGGLVIEFNVVPFSVFHLRSWKVQYLNLSS